MRHIDALREAVRRTRLGRPFAIDAWVVLPEHPHCVITLPGATMTFPIAPRRSRSASSALSHPPSGTPGPALPAASGPSGNVAFGSMRSATTSPTPGTWITAASTRSNTARSPSPGTGRTPPSTAWSRPAFTPPTGAPVTPRTSQPVRRGAVRPERFRHYGAAGCRPRRAWTGRCRSRLGTTDFRTGMTRQGGLGLSSERWGFGRPR